jgi:hypothetical protein
MGLSFKYLGGIIPVMIVEVIVLVYVVWKLASNNCMCKKSAEDTGGILLPEEQVNAQNISFQNTYSCSVGVNTSKARAAAIGLCIYRAVCFCYFFGVGVLWNLIRHGGWQYFTNWNLMLISVFYFSAFLCSVIGLRYGHDDFSVNNNRDLHVNEVEWSRHVRRLGYLVHVLFEVCGGTALLVTTVDFTLLNPQFEFWNASEHFATMLSFLIELCLNCLPIRMDHFGYNALWASIYLVFIWSVVGSGARHHWPYSFLDVSSAACFVWYTGLLIADLFFYGIWAVLHRLKVYLCLHVLGLSRVYSEHDLIHGKDNCTDNALMAGML